MSDINDDLSIPVQYALGMPSRRTGLGGLSVQVTIVGFIGALLLFIFIANQQIILGIIVAAIFGLLMAVMSFRRANRSLAQYGQMIFQDWQRRRNKANVYVSGEFSRVPGGHRRLPGLLARTEAISGIDSNGREFVVILDRPRREATVLLDVTFTGQIAVTQTERNLMTAEWARWLQTLSLAGDILQMAVVIATRPGTGALVAREVSQIVSDDAPEIAKQIMYEAAQTISMTLPEVVGHIAITVKLSAGVMADNDFMSQLATRVPSWAATLEYAGMVALPMSYEQAVARIHSFYNPAAEADFEALDLINQPHEMKWEDAGPSMATTQPKFYEHNGVRSLTWEMSHAPRSTFEDNLLQNLIVPHSRVNRKRVMICYRPFSAGAGAKKVEDEHRDAMVAANSSKKIRSANAEIRLEHTEAARRAQARGAQLGKYSLFVTATIDESADMRQITHDIEQLGAGSSIQLQLMRRQQDVGFQVTCGVGLIPWSKTSTSSWLSSN